MGPDLVTDGRRLLMMSENRLLRGGQPSDPLRELGLGTRYWIIKVEGKAHRHTFRAG